MKKRIVSLILVLIMAFSFAATALAAQTNDYIDKNVATEEKLYEIVSGQVKGTFGAIEAEVGKAVTNGVMGIVGSAGQIQAFAAPYLKKLVIDEISKITTNGTILGIIDKSVDSIVNSKMIETILTSEFSKNVIRRTAEYSTAEIFTRIGLKADQDAAIQEVFNKVWNAPLRNFWLADTKIKSDSILNDPLINLSYYDYSITGWNVVIPSEITVHGWHEGNISALTALNSTGSLILNSADYISELTKVDYMDVIVDCAKRAVWDEIIYQKDLLLQNIKNCLVGTIEKELAKIGVNANLSTSDSYGTIISKMASGIANKTVVTVQNVVTKVTNAVSSLFGKLFKK